MKKKRIRKGQVITMKRMIKGMVLVALALTVVLGLESRVDAAGRTVRISKKNFPSKAVRVELKQRWDEDSDGKLSPSEIKKVKYLIVFASEDEKKTSLKGMQYFYNLKSVDLDVQTMNHIDLRKNKKLESLEISGKKLSGLKFYGRNLKTVDISVEQYKGDLNLRNLPKLEKVSISSDGKYNKIDLSGSKVQSIDIGDHWTSVKYLDFSNCKRLQYATVQLRNLGKMKMKGSNGLKALDLETYYPEDSTIRKVDVSRMRDLVSLNLSESKILQLSVKNNKKLEVLNVPEMWIENGYRFLKEDEPYGLENGENFTLYMPETPIEQLSEDFLIWWPSWYYSEEETVRPEKLSCYGMCNEAMQYGFFSYEGMDVFEPYISK